MLKFAVFLVVLPYINEAGKLRCIYGDTPICGNDGVTYLNVCDFQIIRTVHPYLHARHLGQCAPGNQLVTLYQQRIKSLESPYGGSLRKRKMSNRKYRPTRPHHSLNQDRDYLKKTLVSKLYNAMFKLSAFNFNMENNSIATSGNDNLFQINFGKTEPKEGTTEGPLRKRVYEDEPVREVELPY